MPQQGQQEPEEEECGWCKFMKAGPCRKVFEVRETLTVRVTASTHAARCESDSHPYQVRHGVCALSAAAGVGGRQSWQACVDSVKDLIDNSSGNTAVAEHCAAVVSACVCNQHVCVGCVFLAWPHQTMHVAHGALRDTLQWQSTARSSCECLCLGLQCRHVRSPSMRQCVFPVLLAINMSACE